MKINWLADWLIDRYSRRPPDFIVGRRTNPYLYRWRIIPRNRFFNIYLHKFMRSDDDRALHDHEYDNVSLILRGGYTELFKDKERSREAGHITCRLAQTPHRILLDEKLSGPRPCWTLFITGPRRRSWGFWCPQGWRHWMEYLAEDYTTQNNSHVGKGCN